MNVSLDHTTNESLNCPTCGARQQWSDECRRCRCDLSLLHDIWREGENAKRNCLIHLRGGDIRNALQAAQRGAAINPNDDTKRLLAICYLLLGDWSRALKSASAFDIACASGLNVTD